MAFELFLKGALIGFSIAAPVGPIGLLCIKRTLSDGRLSGFLSGLGAACADALYGMVAALGLGALTHSLMPARTWLHLLGGAFVIYLGLKTACAPAATRSAGVEGAGLLMSFLSTLLLTLTNPMTILSFAAVFSSLSTSGEPMNSPLTVLGVFTGSAIWWLILSTAAGALGARISDHGLVWINRSCGAMLIILGVAALV